jgi:voltage-gated potassium channel
MSTEDEDSLDVVRERARSLDRRDRRLLVVRSVARIVGLTALFLIAYFAAPVGQDADVVGLVLLTVGAVGFVALLVHQVDRILNSPVPQLRAAEALATIIPLVVIVFALVYVGMSAADESAFTEPVTKVNGLYFTTTVLTTVGFGDITAQSEQARLVVTVQMLVDLAIIGVVVRVIMGASRIGVKRRQAEAGTDREGPA